MGACNAIIPTFTAYQYPTTMRNLGVGAGNFAAGIALIIVPYLWLLVSFTNAFIAYRDWRKFKSLNEKSWQWLHTHLKLIFCSVFKVWSLKFSNDLITNSKNPLWSMKTVKISLLKCSQFKYMYTWDLTAHLPYPLHYFISKSWTAVLVSVMEDSLYKVWLC